MPLAKYGISGVLDPEASEAFLAVLAFPPNFSETWTEYVAFLQMHLRKWSDKMRQNPHLMCWLKPVLCQLNFLFNFWAVFPIYCKEHLLQVIR